MGMTKGQTTMGDIRNDRRRALIMKKVIAKGSLVQRKVGEDRKGEIAMLNFLKSPKTSPAYIMAPDVRLTAEAVRGRRIVAAQDTTEVNFAGRDKRRKKLGPGGNGKTPGFFIHAVIAIDADTESVLGPVAANIWTRDLLEAELEARPEASSPEASGDEASGDVSDAAAQKQEASKKAKKAIRAFEEKESVRWHDGAVSAADVLQDAAQIIVVGDRESDVYPVFARKPDTVDFVIRAGQDRALAHGGYLFNVYNDWQVLGTQKVRVEPKKPGERARFAEVALKAGSVTLRRPKKGSLKTDPKTLTLNMVVAIEVNPPEGVKPLLWRLLTTLPISTFEELTDAVRIYRLRWRIEQLFRTLKKDGLDLEAIQHEEASRIMKVAALGVVASCRIMQLVDARDGSDRPATDAIPAEHIKDVAALGLTLEGRTERQKNPWKIGTLSWLTWIVARLGGYKKAGPKTMADGWKQLHAMLRMLDVKSGRLCAA
jgi:hypothetical protein